MEHCLLQGTTKRRKRRGRRRKKRGGRRNGTPFRTYSGKWKPFDSFRIVLYQEDFSCCLSHARMLSYRAENIHKRLEPQELYEREEMEEAVQIEVCTCVLHAALAIWLCDEKEHIFSSRYEAIQTRSVVITQCYLYTGCRILHFELDETFCETSSAAPETKRASQKTFCKHQRCHACHL